MTWNVEYTDTFSGEANYSWVRRYALDLDADASDLAVARAAKLAAGLNGVRGRSYWLGETYVFRPYGSCTILFASLVERGTYAREGSAAGPPGEPMGITP